MVQPRSVAIRNGRVICPGNEVDAVRDLYIEEGRIAAIEAPGQGPQAQTELEAAGMIVGPGLVDVHVHLREPGAEHKETIETGTRAALRGGFTSICAMPNTDPPPDSPEAVQSLRRRISGTAWCRAYPIGAATVGNAREELTDFAALKQAGCIAISDDAYPLRTVEQRREALLRAAQAEVVIIAHLEDEELSANGVMHEGRWSEYLGVSGQAAETEVRCLEGWREAWDDETKRPPLHLAHVSTALTVELLRGWRNGPTAETAPHYLTLTDEDVKFQGANAKMNPPLRSEDDREALRQAVADGIISVIATDHAPHTEEEKSQGLAEAPFGVVGLETALGAVITDLVWPGIMSVRHSMRAMGNSRPARMIKDEMFERGPLTMPEAFARLSRTPAGLFGLEAGTLEIGAPADVVVVDPRKPWHVEPGEFESMGRNTPFAGETLLGKVEAVIIGGNVAVRDGRIVAERPAW